MSSTFMIRKNRAMDAMKTMAAAITHDFNTTLTTVSCSIELAMDDIATESPTYEDLDRVLQTSLEAAQSIRDIMEFCNPGRSGFDVLDTLEFAHLAVDKLERRLPKQIHLHGNFSVESYRANADSLQLIRMLELLTDNAVEALGPSGGSITFTLDYAPMPDLDYSREICLRLRISDQGPGVPGDILPMIFDPFFTTKSKKSHRGLGLSMVFSLAENHGGLVMVSSTPHEQTTFDLYLPVLKNHDH